MNWHYGQPITDGQYLCCVKGYSSPFILDWHDREWGHWNGTSELVNKYLELVLENS